MVIGVFLLWLGSRYCRIEASTGTIIALSGQFGVSEINAWHINTLGTNDFTMLKSAVG